MLKPPHKVTRRIAPGAGIPPAIRKPSNPQSPEGLGLPLNSPDKSRMAICHDGHREKTMDLFRDFIDSLQIRGSIRWMLGSREETPYYESTSHSHFVASGHLIVQKLSLSFHLIRVG
jgi:hypothetical protein